MVCQLSSQNRQLTCFIYACVLAREPTAFQDMVLVDRNYLHLDEETSSPRGVVI